MTLENYLQERKLNGLRKTTLQNDTKVLKPLNDYKKLDDCTEQDIKNYIELYKEKFEEKHKRKPDLNFLYIIIKKYYKNSGKPEIVKWMKPKNLIKPLNQNELPTSQEILRMIQACNNERNKCLIATGYDSGMRKGELLSIPVDDVKILENEYTIRIPDNREGTDINSKTGSRTMTLIESFPYMENYLKVHDGSKKLFPISKSRADQILKEAANKAGIKKNIFWHLIRHSTATKYAKLGMQETSMKKRLGWTPDSKMIERYTHLTDSDADKAYKKALGFAQEETNTIINPIACRCAKCSKLIVTGEYCPQCSEIQRLLRINEKLLTEKDTLEQTVKNQEADTFILKHQHNDTSTKLQKLSDDFNDLNKKLLGVSSIIGAIKEGIITPDELNSISKIETSKDTDDIKVHFDNSTSSYKIKNRLQR